ncbi:MAG: hypothetical protein K8U57_02710 [Planctomycetes bacterium]|nr:hypothetical protein [Planctomycetota bacterium]
MLRRPSKWSGLRPEEGCSSTAITGCMATMLAVWNNPTNRGSASMVAMHPVAVP